MDFINNRGGCGHQIQVILSFQPFLDDLQMEESQETAAEAKTKRHRRLRLKLKGSIIKLEFFQRIPQIRILCPVCRIHAAINHGVYFFVSWKGGVTRPLGICDRITHAGIPQILYTGRHIPHHSGGQLIAGNELACAKIPHFHCLKLGSCGHHAHFRPL